MGPLHFKCPSALAFSLAMRSNSCWMSTSSARGMKTRAAWVTTSTMPLLIQLLKMLHPFMPFITEEIYQALPHVAGEESPFLMRTDWPGHAQLIGVQILRNLLDEGVQLGEDPLVLQLQLLAWSGTTRAGRCPRAWATV